MALQQVVPLLLLALLNYSHGQHIVGDQKLTSCQDYYSKLNKRTNGNYLVEISPYVMIEVYCDGMNVSNPTEYLTLQQGPSNHVKFFRYVGKPNTGSGTTCGIMVPQQDANGWGFTLFTKIRFNPVTKLVNMSDFTFSISSNAGSMVDYGTAGDQFAALHDANCLKGNFRIDLTGTPFEVDPAITWSWKGQMYDNAPNMPIISDTSPRQIVSGKCGGYPGRCFPALKRSKNIPKLILSVVSTNPCVHVNTTNPCQNGATCIPDTASAYRCRCLPGWSGPNCEDPEPDKVVKGTLSSNSDDSPSTATCPSGYTLTHCQCSISRCDGAVISSNSESCTVRNANLGGRVRALINCTRYNSSLVTTSVTRMPTSGFNSRYPTFTCPTGWKLLACTYHSWWYLPGRPDSGLGTIEAGNTCKVDCQVSSSACAIYAKCYTDHCLCLNGGTCSAITHHCICPTGYVGSRCEKFDFCAWQLAQQGSPPCQNGGTCQSIPSTAIGTYDGDGIGGDCKLPFTFKQKTFNQCVDSNVVGPPFACGVVTNGGKDYVDLGSWSPGTVFTIEGWVKPKLHVTGRKVIFGSVDSCNGWGLAMNNDKFSYMFRRQSGCTATRVSSTVGYIDQWHHVAIAQDGNTMTLYVNGTKRSSATTKDTFVGSAASFRVGGAQCCNNYWSGLVKNLNVWKKSLGATEILNIFKKPLAPFNVTDNVIRNHLIAAYEFGDNPPVECTGGVDHKNADWTPSDGEIIAGIHCNIKLFYIPPGVTVTVANWKRTKNSNSGVNGTVTIYAMDILIKGSLLADGKGYQGGATPTGLRESGKQGESFSSAGSSSTGQLQGAGGGGLGDPNSISWGKPGGGGGHGTAGQNGYSRSGGQGGVGIGGIANSHGDLRILELGAGGGSGGNDNVLSDNPKGGKGGNGGGGIHLDARNTLVVTGMVSANGEAGQGDSAASCVSSNCHGLSTTNCWDWSGPGGGGAGGSIFLRGLVVDIGIIPVTATPGRGGYGSTGCGGDGGMGRIRIDSHILNGNTNPPPVKVVINNTFNDLAVLARDALPPSTAATVPEPSVYLGCFEDTGVRQFNYKAPDDNTLTPDKCKTVCYQKGYKYYALQYYRECFCDNNFGRFPRKPEQDCSFACAGDNKRECGGAYRLSIYGPVPRSPAVALANAVQSCEPYCKTGWRGRFLYGLCIGQGKVNSWDIKCTCPAGFTGSRCQDPCAAGKHGVGCTGTCQCKNGGICDPVDGSCDCAAGWTGQTCTAKCSATKFGPGCTSNCRCNRYCSPSDSLTCGYTDKTHKVSFLIEAESGTLGTKGASVRKASSSASGGFYVDVSGADTYSASKSPLIASYTLNITVAGDYYPWLKVITPHGKANSVFVSFDSSGKTTWHIPVSNTYTWRVFGGFRAFTVGKHILKIWKRESGVKIDQVFVGPAQAASTCDRFNGSCTCQPGYTGQLCQNPCDLGKYGLGCSQRCKCSTNGVCDPRDGSCHCLAGWQGATCNTACSAGTYGTGCQAQCKCSVYGKCDPVSGACKCKAGYTGPTCDQLCPVNHYGQNCTSVCQCRNGGNCDAITGTCQCPPGYTGSNCGQACPVGKYGQDCKQACKCSVGASTCNHITGHCDCKPGFKGANCKQQCGNGQCGQGCKFTCRCNNHGKCGKEDCSCSCYAGWSGVGCATACGPRRFGENCAKTCTCKHVTRCSRSNGQCFCQDGWKGSSCDTQCAQGTFGKNCNFTCKCVTANSQSCDPVDGTCTCKRGWSGLFCETPCPKDKFGTDCLGNCSCQNGGLCHSVHGSCDCPRGYQGGKCQFLCSTGTFGYGCNQTCVCKNGAICDPIDGTCNCTAGWFGPLCDTPCSNNTWGLQCANSCVNCSQGTCDSVTGACKCFDGFTGKWCTQPCPTGTFGPGCHQKCSCTNGACDIVDGTCTCNPGYKGADCSAKCDVGTYGVGCVSVCQRTCPNSLPGCDPVDGHCMCTAGWAGPWCNSSCADGTYGQDCSKSCSSCVHPSKSLKCHPVTGACVCSHGYLGDNCDQPCDDGWWGLNCTEQCACPALRSTCDKVDGTCSCLPGYLGDSCDRTCPQGLWGVNCAKSCGTCVSNPHGVCNPVNGNCECRAGWMGSSCSQPCPNGKWGVGCQEDCLCEFGTCSPVDGSCSCHSGYMGQYCDSTCVNNTFGEHCSSPCPCQNGATCNAYNGICYCSPGYDGDICDQVCSEGYFGHRCSRKCDCENQAKCNTTTGECICPPGHVGARCEEICPDTNWGIDCKFACDECVHGSCNKTHGGCDCDLGWQGANCSTACSRGTYGENCIYPCPECPNNYPCSPSTGLCLCGGVEDYCVHGYCSSGGECGCDPGYQGDDCATPCALGRYGEACGGICDCGTESCAIATGVCGCDLGKCGSRCEQTCDCDPGYQGDDCATPCALGRYGEACGGICDCGTESCAIATGVCGCDLGKCGSRCEQTCDCPNGCAEDTCECIAALGQSSSSSSSSDSLGMAGIVGVAVGCVLLGVFIAVVIFIYLRYQAGKGSSFESTMDTTGQVKFDTNAENVGFSNPIYSTAEEPIKANPIYSSRDDQLDDESPDYTAPY